MTTRTVGLLGGSFNPPHAGHIHIADEARRLIGLDEVWLWVSHNIFKDRAEYAPMAERLKSCSIMARSRPWLRPIGYEEDFPDSTTASALTVLAEMHPQTRFVWIFGDDNLASFHKWSGEKFMVDGKTVPDWQYIMHHFGIAVMHRPPYRDDARNSLAAAYGAGLFLSDPHDLAHGHIGWSFVDNTSMDVSSTNIKDALKRGERHLRALGLDPEVEAQIYAQGLYGVTGVPHAAEPVQPVNTVRFECFLTLAAMAHTVKSVCAADGSFDGPALLDYAARAWDKTHAKGDFNRADEVPGELADNLISLCWMASPLNVTLPEQNFRRESQTLVDAWCNAHYPDRSIARRALDTMEELAELCACEGMERTRMLRLLGEVFDAPDVSDPAVACARAQDILAQHARAAGGDVAMLLDRKMAENRARTPEQSAARVAAKARAMRPA